MRLAQPRYAVAWVDYRSQCPSVGSRSIKTATQEEAMIALAMISFPLLSIALIYVQVTVR